jgi:FixJ family two-component response regulator
MADRPVSVAVVDDDAGLRRALDRLLRAAGFAPATYASAEEFLASPGREGTDCLVLDIHLGGMSGFDLQSRLAERGGIPPIVFVTAHDNPEYPLRARQSGSVLLAKPVPAQVLLDAVRAALAGARG